MYLHDNRFLILVYLTSENTLREETLFYNGAEGTVKGERSMESKKKAYTT